MFYPYYQRNVRRLRGGKRCTKHWSTAKADADINKGRGRKKTRLSYIENGNEEPVEKYNGGANIGRSPKRDGKRGAGIGDLTPVEGENSHGKTMDNPKELVDFDIVWSHPANP